MVERGTILITGSSTGIGRTSALATAGVLSDKMWDRLIARVTGV